jgi:hypothetical protein
MGENAIGLHVQEKTDKKMHKAKSILRNRIEERCNIMVAEEQGDISINLGIKAGIGTNGFSISDGQNGVIDIIGNDYLGLIYGIGKFLRTSFYDDGTFKQSKWRGTSVPHCAIRGMYFATHYYNWYHVAPEEEIVRYVEDLALWGVNYIAVVFPFIDLKGWDDSNTDASLVQVRKIMKIAKKVGLKVGLLVVPNSQFMDTPEFMRAVPNPDPTGRRGNHGVNLCPSIPEAKELIIYNYDKLFEKFSDIGIDIVGMWPYDEGGCACEECYPWGAKGFLMISQAVGMLAKKHFPNTEIFLSTWCYDTPFEGEWEGLSKYLKKGNNWIDYIMADAHEDFPTYPLEYGVPGNLSILNFPEISMWGLAPWGGFGANPLPKRVERLWNQVKHILSGGFAYSEGIFEDINKIVVTQLYWEDRSWVDIMNEYISYEYSPYVIDEVLEIIELIEKTHTEVAKGKKVDVADLQKAYALAEKVDTVLPDWSKQSWRWRILYLRTLLDFERYHMAAKSQWLLKGDWSWAKALKGNEIAQCAFKELIQIYHARLNDDYPKHRSVRPPFNPK